MIVFWVYFWFPVFIIDPSRFMKWLSLAEKVNKKPWNQTENVMWKSWKLQQILFLRTVLKQFLCQSSKFTDPKKNVKYVYLTSENNHYFHHPCTKKITNVINWFLEKEILTFGKRLWANNHKFCQLVLEKNWNFFQKIQIACWKKKQI